MSYCLANQGFRPEKEVDLQPNELNAMKLLQKLTRERNDVSGSIAYFMLGRLRATMAELEDYNRTLKGDSAASAVSPSMKAYSRMRATELVASFGLTPGEQVILDDVDGMINGIEALNGESIATSEERLKSGRIEFLDLAELYKPGARVRGPVPGLNHEMAFLVRSCWFEEVSTPFGKKHAFFLELEFFASVGDRFSLIRCVDQVGWWRGIRDVTSLFLSPLDDLFVDILAERGQAYADVATGTQLLQCRAGAFHTGRRQDASKASRVMVDIITAMEQGVRPVSSNGTDAVPNQLDMQTSAYKKAVRAGRLGKRDPNVQRDKAVGLLVIDTMAFFDAIPKERLWNCWPMVPAFSFDMKRWGLAEVSGLGPIPWREEAWDSLVLPKGRKKLIKAVVLQQRKVQNVDVIKGKGEGTTFLLFGASGTGKTLTAEALAEVLHKPLYVLSAGEMGTTPAELESILSGALLLCTKWDCICLIDEADIFLEERTGTDVLRNALVCVMLRQIEYHQGVLFLTTNKARGIDQAVQSRLTLALKYNHLNDEARLQVWKNLLEKVKGGPFDIERLAQPQINGRQIKNCIKLAMALSLDRGTQVTQDMLESTLNTICTFQQDLQDDDEPEVILLEQVRAFLSAAGQGTGSGQRPRLRSSASMSDRYNDVRGSNASVVFESLANEQGTVSAEEFLSAMLDGRLRVEKTRTSAIVPGNVLKVGTNRSPG